MSFSSSRTVDHFKMWDNLITYHILRHKSPWGQQSHSRVENAATQTSFGSMGTMQSYAITQFIRTEFTRRIMTVGRVLDLQRLVAKVLHACQIVFFLPTQQLFVRIHMGRHCLYIPSTTPRQKKTLNPLPCVSILDFLTDTMHLCGLVKSHLTFRFTLPSWFNLHCRNVTLHNAVNTAALCSLCVFICLQTDNYTGTLRMM